MPCRCDGWAENPTPQEKINELETLLCSAAEVLELHGLFCEIHNSECKHRLAKWWNDHKKEDLRIRLEKERHEKLTTAANKALKKLSKEDLEALKYVRDQHIPF